MNLPDLINSGYEAFGSVMIWLNVATVYKHKQVRGIHLGSMTFFTSWGFWNLYYYPHLHQWASFAGGLSIFLANIVWLWLAVYYHLTQPWPPKP